MYKNRAFIFPGQGSQKVGMGKDFADNFQSAKNIFDIVDNTLEYTLSDTIFTGPANILSETLHTQPALMATSIAILTVLLEESGKNIEALCSVVAGHSLGEYSALCASQAISLQDTTKLLKIRAESMQKASPKGEGGMAACIGISYNDLQKIIDLVITNGVCQIANDNVEGQIVISGHNDNIDYMVSHLKENGYRAVLLNVSAPFHSSLISSAKPPMKVALDEMQFNNPALPVVQNVTASMENNPDQIKTNLLAQICSNVRWRETMDKFAELGITELVEIGSGRVLSGLAKKSPHEFTIKNISSVKELEIFVATL